MSNLEPGYPTEWSAFCSHAPNTGTEFFGFVTQLSEVNRFAARFRAASSFRGITLEGYSAATATGYAALCRILFVYSAFEAYLEIVGATSATIGPDLEAHGAISLIKSLRMSDIDNRFYKFIHSRVNRLHQQELQNYFNDDPCNVAYLASAIRHIFAHGWLTPNAGGGEASSASEVCNAVSDFLLSFMDSQFSSRILQVMGELYGS